MSIDKFIKQVSATLGLNDQEKESKKKYFKLLLKKLIAKKRKLKKLLKEKRSKKESKEYQEELEIISIQIKKGKKILHKLYK